MLQLQVDKQWRKNGGTKFTSCNLKVHWRSDTCHDVYNVVKNIDVVKKKFKTWNHRRTMKNTGGDLSVAEKTQKTFVGIATLFVDFAENQRNRLFEASDWLLAEAPRLFLSGSLAHPRRLPQVPRSFRPFFFFCLVSFLAGRRVFCFLLRSLFRMLVSFHRFFIQMKWVHTSMQFV